MALARDSNTGTAAGNSATKTTVKLSTPPPIPPKPAPKAKTPDSSATPADAKSRAPSPAPTTAILPTAGANSSVVVRGALEIASDHKVHKEIKRNLSDAGKSSNESLPSYLCRKSKEGVVGIFNGLFKYHPALKTPEIIAQTIGSLVAADQVYDFVNNKVLWFVNKCTWRGESAEQATLSLAILLALSTYIYTKKLFTDGTFFISNHRYTIDALWVMVQRQVEALEDHEKRIKVLEQKAGANQQIIHGEKTAFEKAKEGLQDVIHIVSQMRHLVPERALEFEKKIERMQKRIARLNEEDPNALGLHGITIDGERYRHVPRPGSHG